MLSRLKATLTLTDLKSLPTTTGRGMMTPISHYEFASAVVRQVKELGLKPERLYAHVERGGADVVGVVPVQMGSVTAGVGFSRSNAYQRGMRLYCGAILGIENSAVVTERIGKTINNPQWIEWESLLWDYVRRWHREAGKLSAKLQKLKETELTDEAAGQLTIEAGRAGLMPWSRVGRVDALSREADHQTAWALAVAFGRMAALNPPWDQMENLHAFYELLKGVRKPKKSVAAAEK